MDFKLIELLEMRIDAVADYLPVSSSPKFLMK